MDLKQPRRKKGTFNLPTNPPLPLILDKNGKIKKFDALYDGFTVTINRPDEMQTVNSMGSFGKGNLSRNLPNNKNDILRERQYKSRIMKAANKPVKVLIVPDSDDETDFFTNLQPRYELDRSGLIEALNLSPEEGFFLMRIDCLNINRLTLLEAWRLFVRDDRYFLQNYAAYHYYRAKNWIVKPGIKYGGDYVLYKESPRKYHSSYVVIIDTLDENLTRLDDNCRRSMDLLNVSALQRLSETTGKELIICQLIFPSEFDTQNPDCISKIGIKEVLTKRWIGWKDDECFTK